MARNAQSPPRRQVAVVAASAAVADGGGGDAAGAAGRAMAATATLASGGGGGALDLSNPTVMAELARRLTADRPLGDDAVIIPFKGGLGVTSRTALLVTAELSVSAPASRAPTAGGGAWRAGDGRGGGGARSGGSAELRMLERMFSRQSTDYLSSRWRGTHSDALRVSASVPPGAFSGGVEAAALPGNALLDAASSLVSIDWSVDGSPSNSPSQPLARTAPLVQSGSGFPQHARRRPLTQQSNRRALHQVGGMGLDVLLPAADSAAMPVGWSSACVV